VSAFIMSVKRTGPSTVLINSTDEAEAITHADYLAMIGFVKVFHWKTQEGWLLFQLRDTLLAIATKSHISKRP